MQENFDFFLFPQLQFGSTDHAVRKKKKALSSWQGDAGSGAHAQKYSAVRQALARLRARGGNQGW